MKNNLLQKSKSACNEITCRLCSSDANFVFEKTILYKHQVYYYECQTCKSLQTEYPYWLDEAYEYSLSNLDTGAVQRNLNNFALCYAFANTLNINSVIDYGGSDGLLCRFLRDHVIDCRTYDKHATPLYAQDFNCSSNIKADLLTAFEVFEHFKDPKIELDDVFQFEPEYLLCSTEIYNGQGPQWPYLAEQGGQHIFFFSVDAINLVAKKYNYNVTLVGPMILFYKHSEKSIEPVQIVKKILTGWIFDAIKPYILTKNAPGVAADMIRIKNGEVHNRTF